MSCDRQTHSWSPTRAIIVDRPRSPEGEGATRAIIRPSTRSSPYPSTNTQFPRDRRPRIFLVAIRAPKALRIDEMSLVVEGSIAHVLDGRLWVAIEELTDILGDG